MIVTPPTPTSLVSSPATSLAGSSTKSTSKRHRGLNILRNYYAQGVNGAAEQTLPITPSTSSSPSSTSQGSSVISPSTSSLRSEISDTPPSIPRPTEDQTIGYFPDTSNNNASASTNSLPSIQEDDSTSQLQSPGANSNKGRKTRSMTRKRPSSFAGSLVPQKLRAPTTSNSTRYPNTAGQEADQSSIESDSMTRDISMDEPSKLAGLPADQMPTIKFIPHQDARSSKPSLAFAPTSRTLPHEGCVIRVGRYSERDMSPSAAPNGPSAAPVGFKSKVVSRRHCEFWCSQGQWYVKDVSSSSGTFLNHIRLSQPNTESRPFPVNDGDIIQLGMDFRGGEESIFKCVKIRIECNRAWQKHLNNFNMSTHKQLRALSQKEGDNASTNSTECSICLMAIAPCQSLFVAPCSHVWHFKCIRPIVNDPKLYPQFLCPNCRAVADLEADIEEGLDGWQEDFEYASDTQEFHDSSTNQNGTTKPTSDDSEGLQVATEQLSINDQPSLAPLASIGASRPARLTLQVSEDTEPIDESNGIPIPSASLMPRDPRTASETLEGVVTPRNEAGPFVFDGSGRRGAPRPMTAMTASSVEETVS